MLNGEAVGVRVHPSSAIHRHQGYAVAAPRRDQRTIGPMTSPGPATSNRNRVLMAALLSAAGLLAGCAAETGGWPRMDDFTRIGQKVLTPQEQDQAIKDMSAEQKAEQAKAIQTIERNK